MTSSSAHECPVVPLSRAAWTAVDDRTLCHLREDRPVHRVRLPEGPEVWLVTRYAEAQQVFLDHRLVKDVRALPEPRGAFGGRRCPDDVYALSGRHLVNSDGADHRRLRSAVASRLSVRSAGHWRPHVEDAVRRCLGILAAAEEPDLVRDYTRPVPAAVVCAVLGFAPEHVPDITRLSHAIVSGAPTEAVTRAIGSLTDIILQQVAVTRSQPDDGLISVLLEQATRGTWTTREVVGTTFSILIGGLTPSSTLLACTAALALEDPRRRRALLDPVRAGEFVEEVLRHTPPGSASTWRFAAEDLTLGGADISAGDIVLVSFPAANRDPRTFVRPGFLSTEREHNPHLTFGFGAHYCVGAPLARLTASIALPALFRRFPALSPAVPYATLRWHSAVVERSLASVPVRLTAT
ncbi:cytochrome P450 [Streptomyces sp. NPDC005876]|uniref:cytochrome P450 n=1 Tax=unclassified Streptomyces TaxID=2593676 RepID=UPI0033EAA67C